MSVSHTLLFPVFSLKGNETIILKHILDLRIVVQEFRGDQLMI